MEREEAGLLQAIGEASEDDEPRLVYADWLDEQGDGARAEFIRVQCEAFAAWVNNDYIPQDLRERERELLTANRAQWINELGVAAQDVEFTRGLIHHLRIGTWEEHAIREAMFLGRLSAVQSLDLSGIGLIDGQLRALANTTKLPALRKLILSDNQLTNDGVAELAASENFPNLETVFLFGNRVNHIALTMLDLVPHLPIKTVDLGEVEEGYCMSPGQVEVERRNHVRTQMLPFIQSLFKEHPALQSAMLVVAQYWNDEADDAVHAEFVVSELLDPVLDGALDHYDLEDEDKLIRSDPNVPTVRINGHAASVADLYDQDIFWDDNSESIPIWASHAEEGGHQEYEYLHEVYSPAVMFYRHGGYEILPPKRPQLDGIRPEWHEEG